MKNNDFEVLLYYKYVDIKDPIKVRDEQREICEKLNLKGRIIIAKEGINGTLEGLTKNTREYIRFMNKDSRFKNINFKRSAGNGLAFPKLSVKARPEIVRLGVEGLNPNKVTGKYLSSEQLHKWFEEKKEFYIVDMRNDYEYQAGFFEGSIFANVHNFFDLPKVLENLGYLKGKTVVTVCTWGY